MAETKEGLRARVDELEGALEQALDVIAAALDIELENESEDAEKQGAS